MGTALKPVSEKKILVYSLGELFSVFLCSAPINLKAWKKLRGNSITLLSEIILEFVADSPQKLECNLPIDPVLATV